MYRSSGGVDVNVPALPVRRSAVNRESPGTPQLLPRQPTSVQQKQRSPASTTRPLPAASSSSSPSSSRQSLANLDRRLDSSRSRAVNDYRDFPTNTTTTTTAQPGDSHLVSRSSLSENQQTTSPPRDVGLPSSWRKKEDGNGDNRIKKENKTSLSECHESIICQQCGRCRCQLCARHRSTARRAVEICSCVSCVNHIVAVRRRRQHHNWSDSDDDDDDEDPCACSPCRSKCCRRWTLLVILSVCLPCLCLYWPLRCVVGACSRCAGWQMRGCRCVERSTSHQLRHMESVVVDRVTST